jgi:O-antigen/teichoic acid export membrane protein
LPQSNLQESQAKITERSVQAAPDQSSFLAKLIPWVSKGGFAILDQGLISGSNFLVSVLLARWLIPEQYGAYAVAFGVMVLLSLVYQSLVLEPMAVFGGSLYQDCLRGYLRSLLWIHVSISAAIILICGTSALILNLFHSNVLAGALAGVTVASPCILVFWLARRSFYLELSPGKAASGAFVYSSLAIGALYFLYHRGLLSPFTAFLLMSVGALSTGAYLWALLRAGLPRTSFAPSIREVWPKHWSYGRWALASCVAGWIPAYIYYPLLSSFGSMAQSGQLKALMNLTLPMEQTKAALSMLLLPYAAGVLRRQGKSSAGGLSVKMTMVTAGGAIAFWAVILPLRGPVFHLLYSGKYMEVAHLLPLIAFGSIVWCAAFGPAICLRAMESPASVFVAFSLATVLSLLVGIPATWAFGLKGAIWGSNLADVLSMVIVTVILRRQIAGRDVVGWTSWWKSMSKQPLASEIPVD